MNHQGDICSTRTDHDSITDETIGIGRTTGNTASIRDGSTRTGDYWIASFNLYFQASEFVQQIVLFSYSCSLFAGLYYYNAWTTPKTIKEEEFDAYKKEQTEEYEKLLQRITVMEEKMNNKVSNCNCTERHILQSSIFTLSSLKNNKKSDDNTEQKKPQYQRVSSLPLDAAARIILSGESTDD